MIIFNIYDAQRSNNVGLEAQDPFPDTLIIINKDFEWDS